MLFKIKKKEGVQRDIVVNDEKLQIVPYFKYYFKLSPDIRKAQVCAVAFNLAYYGAEEGLGKVQ